MVPRPFEIASDPAQLRAVPRFQPGDRVRVHFTVVEGSRRRTQVFEGVVTKRQGHGVRETFTLRKQSSGVAVERTFPLASPKIEKIEVGARGDARRAKLYEIRGRVGRAARKLERRRLDADEVISVKVRREDVPAARNPPADQSPATSVSPPGEQAAPQGLSPGIVADWSEKIGPLLPVQEVANRLLLSPDQVITLAADAAAIALPGETGLLFPAWQFEHAGNRHRLAELHGELVAGLGISPWNAVALLVDQYAELDNRSPVDWLREDRDVEPVWSTLIHRCSALAEAVPQEQQPADQAPRPATPDEPSLPAATSRTVDQARFRLRVFEEDWAALVDGLTGRLGSLLRDERDAWMQIGEQVGYFPPGATHLLGSGDMTDFAGEVTFDAALVEAMDSHWFDRALYDTRSELTPERLEYLHLVLDADALSWDEAIRQVRRFSRSEAEVADAFETAGWCLYGNDVPPARATGTPADWRGATLLVPGDELLSTRVSTAEGAREELLGVLQDAAIAQLAALA